MIEIKHQYTEESLVSVEADSLAGVSLPGADLAAAQLAGCDLHGANLEGASLVMADLSGADLSGCNLRRADLTGVNLSRAQLNGARLDAAVLIGAHLEDAVLSDAHLEGADLSGANLAGAELIGSRLQGTNLSHASLSYAILTGAVFDDETQFPAWFFDPLAKGAVHASTYRPKPLDTSGVQLSPEATALGELLAEQAHAAWAARSITDGWTFGPVRDERTRKHPGLVPYAEMPEAEKDGHRKAAVEMLKTIEALGYAVSKRG
jgi:hypothetical protein